MATKRNEEYARDDADFAEWLDEVDALCKDMTGGFLGIHDLRDHLWRSAYDSGDTPEEAWSTAVCDGIMEL
jgi:hypothetical protein